MTMKVLKDNSQIRNSRAELVRMGISSLDTPFIRLLRRLGFASGLSLGDQVKSWDVLETINFISQNVKNDQPILDIGCYASEVLIALHKLGYSKLTGADLNPDLSQMPFGNSIHYEITDFMQTKFVDGSFKAVTSISVIEHGFNGKALLNEVSRLLQKGGYFIASFDYWPDKIDTTGFKFFGMDWLIFSKTEVSEFIALAGDYGLSPVGDLSYEAIRAPVKCGERRYTFGWLVLRKTGQA